VDQVLQQQQVQADSDTRYYLVNLLTFFSHTDRLFEFTPDGFRLRALAAYYSDARQAKNRTQRRKLLRRIGDVALFVAGVFADSLQRKPVDVDYYLAMGGHAYGTLADEPSTAPPAAGLRTVFSELAEKFTRYVDVLSEVTQVGLRCQDIDLLYQRWLRSGSRQAQRDLLRLGLAPCAPDTLARH